MSTEHIRVQLTGNHPHSGETGYITATDGMVTVEYPAGVSVGMVLVTLENCQHGTTGCYAHRSEMTVYPERRTATPRERH